MGLTILRYLDIGILVAALPVFVLGDLPLLGYATTAAAWMAQRAVQVLAGRRARATGDRRAAIGVRGATMMARLWLLGLSVLAAGLVDREAGLAAAIFAAVLFTVFFLTLLIVKPLEGAGR